MSRTRRRPTLRLAARAAHFALVGAAATVAVAWGCAMQRPRGASQSYEVPDRELCWISRSGGLGTRSVRVVFAGKLSPGVTGSNEPESRLLRAASLADVIGPRAAAHVGAPAGPHIHSVRLSGWPRPALSGSIRSSLERSPTERWRITGRSWAISLSETGYSRNARLLPLLPIWPGFLVDTAFWGGAAFLVWSVPGFVRRRARRRRGRCAACGYDLKGSGGGVCPECGGGGA